MNNTQITAVRSLAKIPIFEIKEEQENFSVSISTSALFLAKEFLNDETA